MLEGFDFTVSYEPVTGIRYFRIIIEIASVEGLIIFALDVSNAFRSTILTNPAEIVYLSLPYIYMECYKIKRPENPLASRKYKELCIQAI